MARMRNTLHATLANGGYRYEYEDGSGLRCTVVALKRRGPQRQTWTHDALANEEFPSLDAAKERLDALTPDAIAAESAKWPAIAAVSFDTCGNACRLCPRPPMNWDNPERVKYKTWRSHLATSWQSGWDASLCEAHSQEFTGDPAKLLAALKAEIAERKAKAISLRAPEAGE